MSGVDPTSTSAVRAAGVAERLDDLRALRDGWLEGQGFAPRGPGLTWLTEAFASYYPKDLPPPRLYPTAEGGVQAEWTVGGRDVSLTVDLTTRTAEWHDMGVHSGDVCARRLDLAQPDAWDWFAQSLRRWTRHRG